MRALGIDYGGRRIGLALSDATGTLARPWKTVPREGNALQVARALANELEALERQDEPVAIVVIGYPRRLNGEPTSQTASVEQMMTHLRSIVPVPVVPQDERLSSHEADELLARSEKDWRKRKVLLDAMAAAVILQDFLDSKRRPGGSTEDSNA